MKYATRLTPLCTMQNRPDAVCRKLSRCSSCARTLHPTESGKCGRCKAIDRQRDVVMLCTAVTRKVSSHVDLARLVPKAKTDEIRERLVLLCMLHGETI